MAETLSEKLIRAHLLEGDLRPGQDIALRIDQTLTQDATGTMAYLQLEAINPKRVRTERSVAYVDHNMLQTGFENADDHRYIQSVAAKYGVYYSQPGNGVCHQVHLERFGVPGKTLLGSDSHTPTGGGLGMLAIGAGGLDVAVAMAGGAYHTPMPRVIGVRLTGALRPFASAKDVILTLLKRLTVKGGVGAILEYIGEGVQTLSVPERATITNMGAELGATTSVFPSDACTLEFLRAQGREDAYQPLCADADCTYSEMVDLDLNAVEPMIACPHSPDHVKSVRELAGMKIDQICIGSCTNSSLSDMERVADMLRGRHVHKAVSLSVSPGSRQVYAMLADSGALSALLRAGARILECGCGPCIGMGFSPPSDGVSLRTFNRNFEGRSGTKDAGVYLVSPETAAASAVAGVLASPEDIVNLPPRHKYDRFLVDDAGIIAPPDAEEAAQCVVLRGPNIKPVPRGQKPQDTMTLPVLLKVGDHITTDHIMPAGAKILPYRSNIPHLSQFCFSVCDAEFPKRALEAGSGVIVGGENYGQGSSREHAALVPLYLGVRAVLAKSFARIHRANLINAGILPLEFADPASYDLLKQGDQITLRGVISALDTGEFWVDTACGTSVLLKCALSERERSVMRAGGRLNEIAEQN